MSAASALPGRPPSPPAWLPSHVQVTVVQARGLRAQGGPGPDAFAALQLGRQKQRTAAAPQRSGPRWAEACLLELPPTPGPDAAAAARALLLQVSVWQRALVAAADRFLGRADVPLGELLRRGRAHPDQWYKLHSKPGKKEKERGEIQLSIQFTRHSLTASMFDLSIKEKPRSPFGKLKDKMKGRGKYDLESASAIVPSSSGALDQDFGLAGRKGKGGGFFFKNKLRKSSLTQSNTSLGSDSTLSSAGSLVGIGPPETGVAPSPSRHSSFSIERSVRDFLPSPKLTHKRAFSDEASQVLPESKSTQNLKPQSEPISRSSLCINGSHIYCEEPSPKPSFLSAGPAPPPPAAASKPQEEVFGSEPPTAPEPELPPWSSTIFPKGPPKDPPRFIPSPPILAAQEEDKLSVKTIALNKHRVRARREEEAAAAAAALHAESKPIQIATPLVFSGDVRRVRPQQEEEEEEEEEERFSKTGFFRRGSGKEDAGKSAEPSPRVVVAAGEERSRSRNSSWFSLRDAKETPQKPSSPDHPCLSEDPPPFATAGDLPSEAQSAAAPEAPPPSPPGPAGAPPEWDDSFDAFATSRLRPEALREPPPAGKVPEGVSHGDGPTEEACLTETPEGQAGGSPDPLSCTPEQTLGGARRESLGGQALGQPSESSSWGEPCEEGPALGKDDATEEQAQEGSGSPCPASDERPPPPQSATTGSPLHGSGRAPEAETGEASVADSPGWDTVGREEVVLHLTPDEASDAGLNTEEARETPGRVAQEQGEGPPPKPPRRFAPLNLGEETGRAAWGVQERRQDGAAAPEELDVPTAGAPSMGEERPPPPAASISPSLAPLAIMGAGGGRATGALGLSGDGAEPAGDNELRGRGLPSGETPGAEQFRTCPADLSSGTSGLSGSSVWQAGAPWPQGLSELGSLQTAKELPAHGAVATRTPPDPQPSPSVLFWTAVEEQQQLPSQDSWPEGGRPGLGEPEEDLPPGLGPSVEQGDPARSPLSQSLPATSPPFPVTLAGGQLRQGRAGSSLSESELSSSWSDDRVVDFKKADFWQAGREEPPGSWTDAALAPGNPFAPWAGTPPPPPSPQNNPFVERPPDPASEAAVLPVSWVEGLGSTDAAPRGLFLAHPSEDQPPLAAPAAPLAFSTPSLEPATSPSNFLFPSPVLHPDLAGGSAVAAPTLALPRPRAASVASSVSPRAEEAPPLPWMASPHPVKPISSSPKGPKIPAEEKEKPRPAASLTPLRSGGQERKPGSAVSVTAGGAPTSQQEKPEPKRDPSSLDFSAKYYHLTHDELIGLLLKREAELSRERDHVRELENYIDLLLVRIMEQSPTLLQIPLGGEDKAAK